jgi:hypothetical protein
VLNSTYATLDSNGKQPVRKGELVFNIRDYGAVGDGATDDNAAIIAALTAASAVSGEVIVPPGMFIFTQIPVPSNVRFVGRGGTLKFKDGTAVSSAASYYPIVIGPTESNVVLDSLVIDGNGANNTSFTVCDAISASGDNIRVQNCTITNPPDSGITWSKNTNSACEGNRISGATDCGIYINDGDGTALHESIVRGNRITGCAFSGIAAKRISQRTIISDNVIYDCGNGITLEEASTTTDYGTNLTIANNRMRRIGHINAAAAKCGVNIRGSRWVQVIGNRVEDVIGRGILVEGCTDCTVMGNIINHDPTLGNAVTGVGITVTNRSTLGSKRIVVNGNISTDAAAHGIHVASASTAPSSNITVIGNMVENAVSAGIRIEQYNTLVKVIGNTLDGNGSDFVIFAGATYEAAYNTLANNVATGTGVFFQARALGGAGSPEGVVTARVGSTYSRTDAAGFYVKTSGTGNTGWQIATLT